MLGSISDRRILANVDLAVPWQCERGSDQVGVENGLDRLVDLPAYDALAATAMELEETGDVDQAALERRLRENLAIAGIPPESVEGELERIMEALAAA